MRSRSSAYVLGLADYLLASWIIEGGFHRRYRERSRFVREDGRWFYVD